MIVSVFIDAGVDTKEIVGVMLVVGKFDEICCGVEDGIVLLSWLLFPNCEMIL